MLDQGGDTIASMESFDASDVQRAVGALRDNIAKVIVGRDDAVEQLLVALLAQGHVLVEDLPGTGKTTLCRALADSLHCSFGRIQFTPDLMPADVLGVNIYDPHACEFRFRQGPIFAHVVLADEINRATPRAQSALLEAMQESQVSVDGVTMMLPSLFMVVATQNPIDMEGTFALPEAQLDRFLLRIGVGMPSREEETQLLARYRTRSAPPTIEAVVSIEQVLAARTFVHNVTVAPTVCGYILDLAAAVRSDDRVRIGASPRAVLALQRACQARAAMSGRDYVIPDDVKFMAAAVLAHRVIVYSQASLRGITSLRVVRDLLDTIAVPLADSTAS
ncbi:MAG: MoxR-like ATPase [Gammaproteobacteria bacterium]|jgi:MoxR-like ATPase